MSVASLTDDLVSADHILFHSPSVIPFGVTGTPLQPVFHMSGFLGTAAPVFEIREAGLAAE